ncbi:MAG TPA: cytochrome c [Rhizomicrobium sp.]|jgi:cytochrome c556|nr:cytochrome c [Rhizomicrobium sp.]
MKLLPVSLAAAALLAAVTATVAAQTAAAPSPAQIVKARQASLMMSAITFASLKQGAEGDVSKLGFPAKALASWAAVLPTLFPAGTGPGQAGDTEAKAEIWTNRAGFEARAADYGSATAKLADLAKAGDSAGFTAQLAVVKKACDSCHADFKTH